MKLVVTAFVTLDGVVEGPGFDEHRTGRNAWALRVQNDEDEVYNRAQVMGADALLLGRRTWQIWAAFWPTATGDPEMVGKMNGIPKYVVSNTLTRADLGPLGSGTTTRGTETCPSGLTGPRSGPHSLTT
jgi:dihydrofolate reductase